MSRQIPWSRSLNAKLGAVLILLLGTSLLVSAANVARLAGMRADAAKQRLFSEGTTHAYRIMAYLWRLPWEADDPRSESAARIREISAANAHRYQMLLDGDPTSGLPAVSDPVIRAGLVERAESWRTQFAPAIERALTAPTPEATRAAVLALQGPLEKYAQATMTGAESEQQLLAGRVATAQSLQYLFAVIVMGIIVAVLLIARGVAARARQMASAAD